MAKYLQLNFSVHQKKFYNWLEKQLPANITLQGQHILNTFHHFIQQMQMSLLYYHTLFTKLSLCALSRLSTSGIRLKSHPITLSNSASITDNQQCVLIRINCALFKLLCIIQNMATVVHIVLSEVWAWHQLFVTLSVSYIFSDRVVVTDMNKEINQFRKPDKGYDYGLTR